MKTQSKKGTSFWDHFWTGFWTGFWRGFLVGFFIVFLFHIGLNGMVFLNWTDGFYMCGNEKFFSNWNWISELTRDWIQIDICE